MDKQMTRRDLIRDTAAVSAGLIILGNSASGQVPAATQKASAVSASARASDKIRVALIHAPPVVGDLAANWTTFERLARQAASQRADLCMSPECFLDGYAVQHANWDRNRLLEAGRTAARQYLPTAKDLAKELGIMLLVGMTYTAGPRCWNSAFLIGGDGTQIGRYDKTHLLDHDLRYDPGMDLPVFQTPFGPMGIMICADRRWPEAARVLRVRGARVILTPTYGMRHQKNEWWMRTRSYENECYICFAHPMQSFVANPKGDIQARRDSRQPGVLLAELDLSNMPTKMLDARRPELYGPLAQPKPSTRT